MNKRDLLDDLESEIMMMRDEHRHSLAKMRDRLVIMQRVHESSMVEVLSKLRELRGEISK